MEVLNKILAAAVDLFRQYGFKTVTMDDVARKTGISKKTLYQHFANKNEVVIESINWYNARLMDQCKQLTADAKDAVEAMVLMMNMYDQEYCQTNPVAMYELERFFPEGYNRFKNGLVDNDVVIFRNNLQQGINEGYYRKEMNLEIIARYRTELSLMQLQPQLLMLNKRYDLPFIVRELDEHFLYGIMTPDGVLRYQEYKQKYIKNPVF